MTVAKFSKRIVIDNITYENAFHLRYKDPLLERQVKYVEDIIVTRDMTNLGMSRNEVMQVISYIGQANYPRRTGKVGGLFNGLPVTLPNFNFLNTTIKISHLKLRLISYCNFLLLRLRQRMCHVNPTLCDLFRLRDFFSKPKSEGGPFRLIHISSSSPQLWCLASGLCSGVFQ